MKSIRTLASVLGLVTLGSGLSCTPPPANNPPGSDGGSGNPPTATFTIKKTGLKAQLDASGITSDSYSTDALLVRWDYTDDGTFDTDWSATKTASHTYPADGDYTARVEIKDPANNTDSATKRFKITEVNTAPTAVFNVNLIEGMKASVDASSSSDVEDPAEDLCIRWDWDGDGNYDTEWTTVKTAEHVYTVAGEYTIKLQVKDLNDTTKAASQSIVASPITIRNGFITYGSPYMIGVHFRMINNITQQPVTPADVPPLTRAYFTISEDGIPIDLSETNQILYSGKRPMFMVLVLDFTGSMYDAGGVNPMIAAAKAFIESQGDTTYICLWAFYERYGGNSQIIDFTPCDPSGKIQLETGLDGFAAGTRDRGATEVWDVLDNIVQNKFPKYDNGVNRGIVFLSDGHDTTSVTTVSKLISDAQKKAAFIYSVGLAFRPEEYPADETNLKKIADQTGGLYFTVNQVGDLSTVFTQLSENINADWTLSYITLKTQNQHTLKVFCNYLDGYTTLIGKFTPVPGDIRKGLLLAFPALDSPIGQTEYTLYADYIPRSISRFRVKVSSALPVQLTLYDTDTICNPADGWTISLDADGWYTISSITPLEYGSWGRIAKCIVDGTNAPTVHFELPSLTAQQGLYGDKTIIFAESGDIALDVP